MSRRILSGIPGQGGRVMDLSMVRSAVNAKALEPEAHERFRRDMVLGYQAECTGQEAPVSQVVATRLLDTIHPRHRVRFRSIMNDGCTERSQLAEKKRYPQL